MQAAQRWLELLVHMELSANRPELQFSLYEAGLPRGFFLILTGAAQLRLTKFSQRYNSKMDNV